MNREDPFFVNQVKVESVCIYASVKARESETQNERDTTRERGEMAGISFPKRGHYVPTHTQPALCPTVPSSPPTLHLHPSL